MPSECFIFFNNSDGVFHSGENISGRFELTTNSLKLIRGIIVRIKGIANVAWDKEQVRRENGREVVSVIEYTNNQIYLDYEKYVLGSKNSSLFELNPGTYNYIFDCELPSNLPSSFTGNYGEIIYEVNVEIDRADRKYSNKFMQPFTVIYALDLNSNPEYRVPKIVRDEEFYSCCSCLCGSGNVEAEITIPYSGYVSGQNIPYRLIISNDTTFDLNEGSRIELKKTISYCSKSPETIYNYWSNILDSKSFGKILRLSKKEFSSYLQIPSTQSTTPQSLNCCITIGYIIKIEIKTGCCSKDIFLTVPIVIGTTPLIVDGTEPITIQPSASNWEENAFGLLGNLDLPPGYNTLGPPSYEGAQKLLENYEKSEKISNQQYELNSNNSEQAVPYSENM